MSENIKIGNKGEDEATKFLEKKGFQILDRNWRYDHKEIDIVAKIDNIIVFVEVKTRKYNSLMDPLEAINLRKQKLLIDAAEAYLDEKNLDFEMRFDVVSVYHDKDFIVEIDHLENAFLAEL